MLKLSNEWKSGTKMDIKPQRIKWTTDITQIWTLTIITCIRTIRTPSIVHYPAKTAQRQHQFSQGKKVNVKIISVLLCVKRTWCQDILVGFSTTKLQKIDSWLKKTIELWQLKRSNFYSVNSSHLNSHFFNSADCSCGLSRQEKRQREDESDCWSTGHMTCHVTRQ